MKFIYGDAVTIEHLRTYKLHVAVDLFNVATILNIQPHAKAISESNENSSVLIFLEHIPSIVLVLRKLLCLNL